MSSQTNKSEEGVETCSSLSAKYETLHKYCKGSFCSFGYRIIERIEEQVSMHSGKESTDKRTSSSSSFFWYYAHTTRFVSSSLRVDAVERERERDDDGFWTT